MSTDLFSKTTCSICHNNKDRAYIKSAPSGVKYYKDPDQKAWKGRKCPSCVKNEHKEYMRQKRGTFLAKLTCDNCHKSFEQKRRHQCFCSKACRIKFNKRKD